MMNRLISRLLRPSNAPTSLGRWGTVDNADIKSALANIDCCGDRLCGDPRTSKQAIDMYTNVKSHIDEPADDKNSQVVFKDK